MCFDPPKQRVPAPTPPPAEDGAASLALGSEQLNAAGATARGGLRVPGSGPMTTGRTPA
jgi:hypothetical protein